MVVRIWDNGKAQNEQGMAGFGGLMAQNIKDIGKTICKMDKAFSHILMETFTAENGWMACHMERESYFKLLSIISKLLVLLEMKALNFGPIDQNT